jgi:hypothetical protein
MLLTMLFSASAVTMNYQGGWLATATYPVGAVVVLNKQTYYALVGANLNKNPVAFPTWWQPLGTFVPTTYKIGSRGPGGGWIFYVDLYDQYPSFTYLEAAPTDIAAGPWCNNTSISIPATGGWAAKGVGKGKANTTAMLGVCTSGAANAADLYLTATKSDWFLPSIGEAKLMYDNLMEAGVGNFIGQAYWTSTQADTIIRTNTTSTQQADPIYVNVLDFGLGMQTINDKGPNSSTFTLYQPLRTRPIRAF